ncbi:MAG: cytidyltransferase, partial [Proteobacteria bacterium]|nr:cytidyltransferase [Pseudomonadota bacterium]
MVTDFGHGLINNWTLEANKTGVFLAVAPQTNSANVGFNLLTKYEEFNPQYACLDEPEARLAAA